MTKLQLDSENFHINSVGWKTDTNDKGWLVNATNDVWQNKKTGQQLFTWDAAVREVSKLKDGRRLPTIDELCSFSDEELKKPFAGILIGGHDTVCGYFINHGSNAYYWSSSESCDEVWRRGLACDDQSVYRYKTKKSYGFSVRLVREVEEETSFEKKAEDLFIEYKEYKHLQEIARAREERDIYMKGFKAGCSFILNHKK